MEAIEKVRKKLSGLKEEAQKAMRQLSRETEIQQVESELKRLEAEELRVKETAMKKQRDDALNLALEADEQERDAFQKLTVARNKKAEALNLFEQNIPTKRVQTSSSQFVRLKREVEYSEIVGFRAGPINLLGERDDLPIFEKRKRVEEVLVDCVPQKLKRFRAKGWVVCPGQTSIKDELLTAENSVERPTVETPEVFYPRQIE